MKYLASRTRTEKGEGRVDGGWILFTDHFLSPSVLIAGQAVRHAHHRGRPLLLPAVRQGTVDAFHSGVVVAPTQVWLVTLMRALLL